MGRIALAGLVGLAAPAWAQGAGSVTSPAASQSVVQPFWLSGWALDVSAASGTGVDMAYVYGCRASNCAATTTFWGWLTYGEARPDVAATYGSQFLNSGFGMTVSGLSLDTYTVAISVRNLASDTWDTYQRTFTVVASNPLMSIDAPTANQAVSQPFAIAGWAVDTGATSGTGVDAVSILAYLNPGSGAAPITLGTVTYGGARSDVAATLGSQFLNSGYTRTESSLAAGLYRFHVFAHSAQTGAWDLRTVDASVDVSAVSLTIDRSGTGTGGVTASGLTCTGGAGTQAVPCSASYSPGASVTLTAAADSGSTFSGWAGPCTGTSPCSVTLTTARYVSATFTKTPTAAVLTYYHTDMIGSVRAITDEAGATVIRHDYGPFGEDTQPMTGDPIRFGGKELDPETGMANFEARYFRQTWGRFSSADPLQITTALTNPQRWNRYAYAHNNPLAMGDPSGLSAIDMVKNQISIGWRKGGAWENIYMFLSAFNFLGLLGDQSPGVRFHPLPPQGAPPVDGRSNDGNPTDRFAQARPNSKLDGANILACQSSFRAVASQLFSAQQGWKNGDEWVVAIYGTPESPTYSKPQRISKSKLNGNLGGVVDIADQSYFAILHTHPPSDTPDRFGMLMSNGKFGDPDNDIAMSNTTNKDYYPVSHFGLEYHPRVTDDVYDLKIKLE